MSYQDSVNLRGLLLSVILFFTSQDACLLWSCDNLLGIIPFGFFVDVYTFLNCMLDSVADKKSIQPGRSAQVRIEFGDDTITLNSFQIPIPKMFGGSNSLSTLKSLPPVLRLLLCHLLPPGRTLKFQ